MSICVFVRLCVCVCVRVCMCCNGRAWILPAGIQRTSDNDTSRLIRCTRSACIQGVGSYMSAGGGEDIALGEANNILSGQHKSRPTHIIEERRPWRGGFRLCKEACHQKHRRSHLHFSFQQKIKYCGLLFMRKGRFADAHTVRCGF